MTGKEVKYVPGSGKRIRLIREHLKITQKEFAEKMGYAGSMFCNIESEQNNPGYGVLLSMAETYNINPNFVLLGKGEMFLREEEFRFDDLDFDGQKGEVISLLEYLDKSPLVRMCVTAYFRKFLLSNETIINKDIKIHKKKEMKNE